MRNDKKNTIKFRIAMILGVVLFISHYISMFSIYVIFEITSLSLILSLVLVIIIVKLKLIYKNYAKGIGVIVVILAAIMWKQIHSYPVGIEMCIVMTFALGSLILSFIYTASELNGEEYEIDNNSNANIK
jgi:hypothetical protein